MEETAIVPMEFREIEPDPEPVSAATKHSPNRRARVKGAMQLFHIRRAQRNWLLMYESTGDETRATDSIKRKVETIRKWKRDDPTFKAAAEVIGANWRDRNQAALANLEGKAIQSIGRMIEDESDKRGSSDIAYKVLKGAGYFREPDMPPVAPGTSYTRERERVTYTNVDAPKEE